MSDDLIAQIDKAGWIRKGGLIVPDDVLSAVRSPSEWFGSLKPVEFALDTIPTIKNLIDFIPKDELDQLVQGSSVELLATAYGANKAFNSTKYKGTQLAARGESLAQNIKLRPKDVEVGNGAAIAHNIFLNNQLIADSVDDYNGLIGDSPEERFKALQETNKSWLEQLFDDASNAWDSAVDSAKRQFSRLMKKLAEILGFKKRKIKGVKKPTYEKPVTAQPASLKMQFAGVAPSVANLGMGVAGAGAIAPVAGVQLISIINALTSSILSTFILKAVAVPVGAINALVQTTTAIVLKGLNAVGIDAIRHTIGGILRGISSNLPAIWNSTGLFTGAWALLTTYAPYIICAAVLVIAAIKMSQRVEIGDYVAVAGYPFDNSSNSGISSNPGNSSNSNNLIPDLVFAEISGNLTDKLGDLGVLRQQLINESENKNYQFIYGFSFDGKQQKQSFDLTSELAAAAPVPIPKGPAELLWLPISQLDFVQGNF
ncbi:MAG TPA: hypothetical protein VK203_19720 [Nostocaceae cyanobacterium]|nr:hypothetical protein [Nostocaceae cyanobacterium]